MDQINRLISLSTGWGWHFNDLLKYYHDLVLENIQDIASSFNCKGPETLQLFRRYWPSQNLKTKNKNSEFYFRWAFFDENPSLELIKNWIGDEDAKEFIKFLLNKNYVTFTTKKHLDNIANDFFNHESNIENYIEDWRAVYLQAPMKGTILDHIWNFNLRIKCNAFIVKPLTSEIDNHDFKFPAFDFYPLTQDWKYLEQSHVEHQAEIELLGTKTPKSSPNKFFQSQLYPAFYFSNAKGGTTSLHKDRETAFFIFIPIKIKERSEWLGVLQLEFFGVNPNFGSINNTSKSIIKLSKIIDLLFSDLLFAQTQEEYDKYFESIKKLDEIKDNKFLDIAKTDKIGQGFVELEDQYKRNLISAIVSRNFFRQFSDQYLNKLIETNPKILKLQETDVSIVFWDIRNFTKLCEILDGHKNLLSQFLNSYCKMASDIIYEYHGILEKFIGDGVMAIFGLKAGSTNNQHAYDAVKAAFKFNAEFSKLRNEWQSKWPKNVNPTVTIGFGCGINSGKAFVGIVGSPDRYQFTAMGSAVNLTSRLQNRAEDGEILSFSTTKSRIEDKKDIKWVYKGELEFKNASHKYSIFLLSDMENESLRDEVIKNVVLNVLSVVFADTRIWEFLFKDNKISASLEDTDFVKSILDKKIRIASGDRIICDLVIHKKYNEVAREWENKHYSIIKVYDIKTPEVTRMVM